MIYLSVEELNTHLFTEIINAISGNDDLKPKAAIDAAIEEARGYLSKYDHALIFNPAALTDRNPILLLYVKDIAAWHFIQLANPNVDIAMRERRYDLAIEWLDKVQKGLVTPTLPYPEETATPTPTGQVLYGGSRKQQTGFL
jgi:phage gp36-like protein